MFTLFVVCLALLLDYCFGEPKRFHPLVGFGRYARWLERIINGDKQQPKAGRVGGVLAWVLAVLPWIDLAFALQTLLRLGPHWLEFLVSAGVLYLALGWQSLQSHAMAVAYPLSQGNLPLARAEVSKIVSRDCQQMDEQAVAAGATESVVENGADAVFSTLFWFLVLGIPGVVAYRLVNTLDAMWGYKNTRYLAFGWAAARADDVLNFIPARLTALSYTGVGNRSLAWQCWQRQGSQWKSPNAGPVMAAGAGAINVKLGGAAMYHGASQSRGVLGPSDGDAPSAWSIVKACGLINRSLVLRLGAIALLGLLRLC